MLHDDQCELALHFGSGDPCPFPECWATRNHCHCGARAFPLCKGCRHGIHLNHQRHADDIDRPCACDLCADVDVVAIDALLADAMPTTTKRTA